MNKQNNLPAGLVDENVEVFDHDGQLKATFKGQVISFHDLPESIMNQFLDMLINDQKALDEFKRNKVMDLGLMIQEYVRCNFGGYDRVPDFENGHFHREYWTCGRRAKCPYREKLCPKLKVKNGELSKREVDIIRMIAWGKTVHDMADQLYITVNTVRTHTRNIHVKLGVNTNIEVTLFAFRNNLITFQSNL